MNSLTSEECDEWEWEEEAELDMMAMGGIRYYPHFGSL